MDKQLFPSSKYSISMVFARVPASFRALEASEPFRLGEEVLIGMGRHLVRQVDGQEIHSCLGCCLCISYGLLLEFHVHDLVIFAVSCLSIAARPPLLFPKTS